MDERPYLSQDRLLLYMIVIMLVTVFLGLFTHMVVKPQSLNNNPVRSIVNEQKLESSQPSVRYKQELEEKESIPEPEAESDLD
jgi:hypothetical protein